MQHDFLRSHSATKLSISLPRWAKRVLETSLAKPLVTHEERMALAIELSRRNTDDNSGGPFGAVIADDDTGQVISIGVNRVVPLHNSVLHGEAVALMFAQAALGTFDLASKDRRFKRPFLYTSAAPCIQCFGMIYWSGLAGMAYAATARDTENIVGFDEGPIPRRWKQILSDKRGMTVLPNLLRKEGVAALQYYVDNGGFVYRPGST